MVGATGESEKYGKKELQRRPGNQPGLSTSNQQPLIASQVPPIVHEVLRSAGQPLDEQTRSLMEPRFGHDFSQVRVHTDGLAAESAKAVNAVAYTVENNIVFGAGRYGPRTRVGQTLLLHELTHVVQQASTPTRTGEIGSPSDVLEQQADAVARRTLDPSTLHPATLGPTPLIQRALDSIAGACLDWIGGLDHERLAARLLNLAIAEGHPERVGYVLDSMDGIYQSDRDDVAEAFVRYADSSHQLATLASRPGGPEVLQRMIAELRSGITAADEEHAIALAEAAIQEANRQHAEARAARRRFLSGEGSHAQFLDWVVDANLDRLSREDLMIVALALIRAPNWNEFHRLPEQNRRVLLSMVSPIAGRLAALAEREHRMAAEITAFERTTGRITAIGPSPREELTALTSMGPFGLLAFYASLLSGGDIHTAIATGQALAPLDGLAQALGSVGEARRSAAVAQAGAPPQSESPRQPPPTPTSHREQMHGAPRSPPAEHIGQVSSAPRTTVRQPSDPSQRVLPFQTPTTRRPQLADQLRAGVERPVTDLTRRSQSQPPPPPEPVPQAQRLPTEQVEEIAGSQETRIAVGQSHSAPGQRPRASSQPPNRNTPAEVTPPSPGSSSSSVASGSASRPGGATAGARLSSEEVAEELAQVLSRGPGVNPLSGENVESALAILRSEQPVPLAQRRAAYRVLLRHVVEEFRDYMRARNASAGANVGDEALAYNALRGNCGLGRDVTLESLASLARQASQPVEMRRIQLNSVVPGAGDHTFFVVRFSRGQTYLVDPTFGQFMTPRGPRGSRRYPANVLRGNVADTAFALELVQNGFVHLTPQNARRYIRALDERRDQATRSEQLWPLLFTARDTLSVFIPLPGAAPTRESRSGAIERVGGPGSPGTPFDTEADVLSRRDVIEELSGLMNRLPPDQAELRARLQVIYNRLRGP
jgi:hypothetical protein